MKAELAEQLGEEGQDESIDIELYEGYSGRGMYGSETTGVSCGMTELMQCIALVANHLPDDEIEDFVDMLGKLRSDSLGRQMIFY